MAAMVPPGAPSARGPGRVGKAPAVPPGNCPSDNPPSMPVGMGMMGGRSAMGPPPPSGKGGPPVPPGKGKGKVPPSGKGAPTPPPSQGGKAKKGAPPFPPKQSVNPFVPKGKKGKGK